GQSPQILPAVPLPLCEPIKRSLPIMPRLGACKKHEQLLTWDHIPDDVVLVDISLQVVVGGLDALSAYSFNADHVTGTAAHFLAHTGHRFHGIPDGCGCLVVISGVSFIRPLHAVNQPLGV